MNKTLIVNLFAGPGAGKSTMAAGVFYDLKTLGITAELALEFAKDLTWEERYITIKDQIYIFGKQYHRIYRLLGQVDVVITDSPLLLTPIYDSEHRELLEKLAVSEFFKMRNYNVFLLRKKAFNRRGRTQTETEALKLDMDIINMLDKHNVIYETSENGPAGKVCIIDKIEKLLKGNLDEKI